MYLSGQGIIYLSNISKSASGEFFDIGNCCSFRLAGSTVRIECEEFSKRTFGLIFGKEAGIYEYKNLVKVPVPTINEDSKMEAFGIKRNSVSGTYRLIFDGLNTADSMTPFRLVLNEVEFKYPEKLTIADDSNCGYFILEGKISNTENIGEFYYRED